MIILNKPPKVLSRSIKVLFPPLLLSFQGEFKETVSFCSGELAWPYLKIFEMMLVPSIRP